MPQLHCGVDAARSWLSIWLSIWSERLYFLCVRGTFGVVKRVVHRRTAEVFAAKFLPLRSSWRTRAFQERDLLSRLAHPRVACLLDFFCTRRTLVLITEMYPAACVERRGFT